ncbi:J domain-containing protein [Limnobacter parvus]|uniref:J domain-containing protein n=1 Tax=Limnobacter parvus TaxID=2939690 RepID=A0ABT1XHX5_9BURK|nr:J domain-containing protein [Limnobacter parvus]MCR2746193.1 J domain-containing protein [Limnobacter parvus]
MSVLLHPQVFAVFPNSLNHHEHEFAQLFIEHAIRTIVADLLLNMLLSQQANSGFRFPPYTPPRPNQFKQPPQFFNSMPRQKSNVEHTLPNKPKEVAASTFVAQASGAVKGVQGIATKFDPNGKTQKEQLAVALHLNAFQQAETPATVQETYDQLKTSLNKLVRRLGLLVHPDKNPAPEATEAFKQLNDLREKFDNTRNTATQ